MTSFHAIPTLAGQAAIAAAIADEAPIKLTTLVVGDGNGNPTTPLETQTGLVHLSGAFPLQSVEAEDGQIVATGIIDEEDGGWTIREAGLLDENGILLFVASVPPTYKATPSEGVIAALELSLVLVISDTAQVTVVSSGSSYATVNYVNDTVDGHRTHFGTPIRPYFVAVDSVAVTAPPDTPATGATYLVPTTATGAWAAHAGKIAQFREGGWTYTSVPIGHIVCDGSTGLMWRRTGSGWRQYLASIPEHIAGTSTTLAAHPAGVAAMIGAALSGFDPGVPSGYGIGSIVMARIKQSPMGPGSAVPLAAAPLETVSGTVLELIAFTTQMYTGNQSIADVGPIIGVGTWQNMGAAVSAGSIWSSVTLWRRVS
ncbi:phage tail protein [Devosia sp. SD17-2]|uniref:phage tail protein n=1 Tax=Devosia sp. SD17-2 TaxID=2976459 RepID=UPI0023D7CD54|nr:phage tail protein [Devosia sp. SD17-2]WEJ33860.1 phage tail protein [Devosia sp. SD17-2]